MGTPTRNYYKGLVYKTGYYDNNEEPMLHVGGEVTLVNSEGSEITSLGGSAGGVLVDQSGNGNNGTINGAISTKNGLKFNDGKVDLSSPIAINNYTIINS